MPLFEKVYAGIVVALKEKITLLIKGNASIIGDNTGDQSDATLPFSDITTSNASILKHGFLSKLPNSNLVYLNGLGLWAVPAGTGVATITTQAPIINLGTATNPILAFQYKTQASIVAHAGGTQALATPLLAEFNSVDTVANALDSVLLLPATEGVRQYVYNNGTNNLNVYPQLGGIIKGGGRVANSPLMMMPHNGTWFTCYVATPSEVGTFRLY